MLRSLILVFGLFALGSCVPKEKIVLRSIREVVVEPGQNGTALLRAKAIFYNPNRVQMTLHEIKISVKVNGKNSAIADQHLKSIIPSRGAFEVPIEVTISLKELGLLDTLMGLLGGKKYDLWFSGYIKVRVHGIGVTVPIDYQDQIKLNR